MKYPIFSVRDKATSFMPPLTDQTDQSAIRNFAQAVNNGSLQVEPSDFDLYKVGYFDDQNGEIEHILPEFMVNGLSVKRGVQDEV